MFIQFRKFRYRALLGGLLTYLLVGPFVQYGALGKIVAAAVATFVFITASLLIPTTRGGRIAYIALLLIAVTGNWLSTLTGASALILAGNDLFTSAFLVITLVLILRWVISRRRITIDEISAAVSAYLLIALVWSHLYHALETLDPGSFLQMGESSEILSRHDFNYFSFVTLTTLGYGDLTPAKPFAKSLTMFEAVIGVFYLAVLISRLVSQYAPSHEETESGD